MDCVPVTLPLPVVKAVAAAMRPSLVPSKPMLNVVLTERMFPVWFVAVTMPPKPEEDVPLNHIQTVKFGVGSAAKVVVVTSCKLAETNLTPVKFGKVRSEFCTKFSVPPDSE